MVLRPWAPDDAEAWFTIMQENGILRYFPNPASPPREKADAYIGHHIEHWNEHGYGHWAVVMPDDGRLVGWNGLEYLPKLGETEVAYLLSGSVRGRGLASEAAHAAIRYGFEAAGLEAIIGLVHPENAASIRVLQKSGLQRIDRLRLWGMEMDRYRVRRSEWRPEGPLESGDAGSR
jgi:ribosomal-protein-alanine N-acetyltransferase